MFGNVVHYGSESFINVAHTLEGTLDSPPPCDECSQVIFHYSSSCVLLNGELELLKLKPEAYEQQSPDKTVPQIIGFWHMVCFLQL